MTNTPSFNSRATAKSNSRASSIDFLKSCAGIATLLITLPSRNTHSAPLSAITPSYGTASISWRSLAALPVAITILIPLSCTFLRASIEDCDTLWVSKLNKVPSTSSNNTFIILSIFLGYKVTEKFLMAYNDKHEIVLKKISYIQ